MPLVWEDDPTTKVPIGSSYWVFIFKKICKYGYENVRGGYYTNSKTLNKSKKKLPKSFR